MSTKKAISTSFVAIFILIITQIIAQSIASMFVIIKIPTGICNITAGLLAKLLNCRLRISECLNLLLK